MTIVHERLDAFPFDTAPRLIAREEDHLLTRAIPGPLGRLWAEVEPIDVVHFDPDYVQQPFAPPRFLYEGLYGRLEWQQMDNRQPIYHRNLDVDELSYQIGGDRTLMTEFGTAELRPGEFVRIPAGVCHDNWGRKESHILWYLPEPCAEMLPADRHAEALIPPFEGWEPAVVNEVITDCLGSGPHDTAAQRADEHLILADAFEHTERLAVVRPRSGIGPEPQWIWQGPTAWIGVVESGPTRGLQYTRHRNADEIQYQISGRRLLVSQHGATTIEPGDFVRIPIGVAFTSISAETCRYITTTSYHRLPRSYPPSRPGEFWTGEQVSIYRHDLLQPVP